jgi:uncharacterized protein YcfJ
MPALIYKPTGRNHIKRNMLVGAIIASFAVTASAQEIVQYGYARVISVNPISATGYKTVPRTSCTTVETQDFYGSTVGDNTTEAPASPRQRCSTYHDREYYNTVTGYNVTFEYEGETRTVLMSFPPANRVAVKVVKTVFVIE